MKLISYKIFYVIKQELYTLLVESQKMAYYTLNDFSQISRVLLDYEREHDALKVLIHM